MRTDFRIEIRRYGPTVHLTPAGELDLDAGPTLDDVRAALDDGVTVVACDMRSLSFIDVTGLHRLLHLARHTQTRGIAFFAYNWQRQPQRLLDLIDDLDQPGGRDKTSHAAPTHLLRRTLWQAGSVGGRPLPAIPRPPC